ncbi:macrophage expressed protein [Elysia marginata]|uniref:Macrophage expressed protein n=1 Tax=Elysia marginata TaxID=1093978 RepID=A0AAV4G4Z3_9GAST|nr:macrophage expressed protein [Elysia marginata]
MLKFDVALRFLLVVGMLSRTSADEPREENALYCLKQFEGLKLFEVNPGVGWDNLRNVEGSQAIHFSFSQCRLMDNGHYLIPDNVYAIPLKASNIERTATILDNWKKSSTLTSSSINLSAGMSYGGASISGSFSHENQELKERQIRDKTVTVRIKLQYNRYEVMLQPHSRASEQFRTSVLDLAAWIERNQTQLADYQAQIMIRDFGQFDLLFF